MADLKLEVDYSEVGKAANSLGQLEGVAKSMGTALARGKMTQSQYIAEMNRLSANAKRLGLNINEVRSQLMRKVAATKQAIQFNDLLAASEQRLGIATTKSSRGMNAMGVGFQQAGYQIGDFLVQIQSGTNAMVAFGQQATQLVGILPMFNSFMGISGTRLVALSAGLGIVIPLMTAVGAAIMRTRREAEDTTDTYKGLGDSLRKLEGIRLNSIGESLAAGAAEAMSQWQPVLDLLERVELRALSESIKSEFDSVVKQLAAFENRLQVSARLRTETPQFDLFGLQNFEQGLELARVLQSIQGNTREELQEQLRLAEERLAAEGMLTPEVERILAALADQVGLVETITKEVEKEQDAQQNINDILKERVESYTQTQQTVNETVDSLNRQIAAQERIVRFGRDSELVAKRTTEAILEEEAARLRAAGATEDDIDRIIALKRELIEVTEEAESVESAISKINKVSMGSVIAQVTNLASVLNITKEAAIELAGVLPSALTRERAIARAGTGGGRGAGGMPVPGQVGLQSTAYPNAGQVAQDLLDREARKNKRQDPLQQLEERLRLEQDLLGKTEAQRRVIQALGVDWRSYGDATIERLVGMVERMDEFNEKVAQQEDIANTIAGSFGDAFMSIVDGTKSAKDAFSDMARHIISRLFEILVIESMVQSIAGAITGAFGGGGPTRPVMRPTPQASGGYQMPGRPYLVGEHGPELVIPGRSGTVMNADLTNKAMGGESINIVNNINVTGGTDPAAIRMEVAKLMPQITNATKTAVIDARRRGGQMKAAFG